MPNLVWFEACFEQNKFIVLNILRKFDYLATVDGTYGWQGNIISQYIKAADLKVTVPGQFQGQDLSKHVYDIAKLLESTEAANKKHAQDIIDNLLDFCITPKKGYTPIVLDALLQYVKHSLECQTLLYKISIDANNNIIIAANFGFEKSQLLLRHILTALNGFDPDKFGNHEITKNVGRPSDQSDIRYEAVAINPLVRYMRSAAFFSNYAKTYRLSDTLQFNLDLIQNPAASAAAPLADEWREPFLALSKDIADPEFRIKLLMQWSATALAMIAELQKFHAENKIHCNLFCLAEKDHFSIQTAFRQNSAGNCKILSAAEDKQAHRCVQLAPGQEYFVKDTSGEVRGFYGSVAVPVAPEIKVKVEGKYRYTQAADVYSLGCIFFHYLVKHVIPLLFYNFTHDNQVYQLIDDLYAQVIKPMQSDKVAERSTLDACKSGIIKFQADLTRLLPSIRSKINAPSEQLFAAIVIDDLPAVQQLLAADPNLAYFELVDTAYDTQQKISAVSLAKNINRKQALVAIYQSKHKVNELKAIKLPDNPNFAFNQIPGVDPDYDPFVATVLTGGVKDSLTDERYVLAYHQASAAPLQLTIAIGDWASKRGAVISMLNQHVSQKTFYLLHSESLSFKRCQDAVLCNKYSADGSDMAYLYVTHDLGKDLAELKALADKLNAASLKKVAENLGAQQQVFGLYRLADLIKVISGADVASTDKADGSVVNYLSGALENVSILGVYAAKLFVDIDLLVQPASSSGVSSGVRLVV